MTKSCEVDFTSIGKIVLSLVARISGIGCFPVPETGILIAL